MKPSKAGKDMLQWAQTANQSLKRNAQTQDADGIQAMSEFRITLL